MGAPYDLASVIWPDVALGRQPTVLLPPKQYWLDRGLIYLSLGNGLFWTKEQGWIVGTVSTGAPKKVSNRYGVSTGFGSTDGTGTTDRLLGPVVTQSTSGFRSLIAFIFPRSTGGGGFGRVLQSLNGNGIDTSTVTDCAYPNGASHKLVWNQRTTTANNPFSYGVPGVISTGVWSCFGYSCNKNLPSNTVPAGYENGLAATVTNNGSPSGTYLGGSEAITLGDRAGGGRNFDGILGPQAIFQNEYSALTADEHLALYLDFYQIIGGPEWGAFVPSGAGASLAAAATAQSTATADLSHGVTLAGAALSVASATAGMSHSVPLAATATATASASGQIALSVNLAASAISQAVATAALALATPLAGAAAAQDTATAGMGLAKPLAGAATGQGTATADLDVTAGGSNVTLAAAAAAVASAGATLALAVNLSAAAISQALATAELGGSATLAAAAIATAQASAALALGKPLAGSAQSSATAGATLWLQVPLGAAALAQAAAGGAISLTVNLAAAALGQASGTANLAGAVALAAGGVSVASAGASLQVSGPLVGTASLVGIEPRRSWSPLEPRRKWAAALQ